MGADNWTTCPKCAKDFVSARDKQIAAVGRQYGKITKEHYGQLMAAAQEIEQEGTPTSLREDYEQGVHDGEYSVDYSCSCIKCGFSWEYHFSKKVI